MNGPWTMLALALALLALLSHNAVVCQDFLGTAEEEELKKLFSVTIKPKVVLSRGDGGQDSFTRIISSGKVDWFDPFAAVTEVYTVLNMITNIWEVTPSPGDKDGWMQSEGPKISIHKHGDGVFPGTVRPFGEDRRKIHGDSDKTRITNSKAEVVCVGKEKISNRDAVKLNLKFKSSCEDTKKKMGGVIRHLCGEDCKLEIFQEEHSDEVIVSGKSVEANAKSMATKFEKEDVKNKLMVKEAAPYWGKHTPAVLVSLLVAGLLLAALLIGGYVLKNHRGRNAKAMKLAEESFQVDVESQGNTLVSVAPLPQEPQPPEKPSINGESPDGGKSQPPPTNGHQGPKNPVADTEL